MRHNDCTTSSAPQGNPTDRRPAMSRKILIQMTAPTVVIGLCLFVVCLLSAWYINRLQTHLAHMLLASLASQGSAQDLEKGVRQLRYHSLLYLIDPSPILRQPIDKDNQFVKEALQRARQAAGSPEMLQCVEEIEAGYRNYHREIGQLLVALPPNASRTDLVKVMKAHSLSSVIEPSEELLRLNKDMVAQTARDSRSVSRQLQIAMILLGLVGPVSGLLAGYGMARGLSRSLYQLSVRVKDMAHHLDQDVASVSIEAEGDLSNLDRQLQHVVRRVEEVAERQQQQQRQLLRAEQLAAVGQLAASVAHEVRNPITAVKMLVEVALHCRNPKPLTQDDLKVIHREIARLEQTVQGLLDFARLPSPHRTACDLRDLVAQAVELVQARARQQSVAFVVRTPPDGAPAHVDQGQWRTVLVNLLLNALDAMPQGGRLEVDLSSTSPTGICLTVADSGAGIPPEILNRLFTPFASTKPTGTGLGLSLSRRIVEEHGGQLTAANRPEGGACFTVTLPVSAPNGSSVPSTPELPCQPC